MLAEGEAAEERFADFADDDVRPSIRKQARATFMPRVPSPAACSARRCAASDGVGACELCFQGASDEEIAACEVEIDPDCLESALLEELERTTGARGQTIVAFVLA